MPKLIMSIQKINRDIRLKKSSTLLLKRHLNRHSFLHFMPKQRRTQKSLRTGNKIQESIMILLGEDDTVPKITVRNRLIIDSPFMSCLLYTSPSPRD